MSAAALDREVAANVPQPQASPQTGAKKPDASLPPPARTRPKRRYSAFRHSPVRVKELRRLLPRKVPRQRDLQIYESVVYGQMSQYDVAQIYDITQPRVCQIVQEVRAWLSTVAWEVPGMSDQQQINLATHETRRWLETIFKKALAGHEKTDAQCETLRTLEDERGHVHRERTYRTHPPTAGFLKVAYQAVVKAGELGGAGQQWLAKTSQAAATSPQSAVPSGRSRIESPVANVSDRETPISDVSEPTSDRLTSCGNSDLRPETAEGGGADCLLKKNHRRFSLEIGKANGHTTSLPRRGAQVQRLRRRQEREIAYRQAADRQGISEEGRKSFYHLLRQLDGLAQRIENQVQRRVRIEVKKLQRTHTDRDIAMMRWHQLRDLLRIDRGLQTFPYGDEWVLKQYDIATGLFRWWLSGPAAAGNQAPPDETPPEENGASQNQ